MTMSDNGKSLDFGGGKIGALFRSLFFPTLIGMVFNALLTIIDGIFVGRGVGASGIAAVNITAPIFMVATGIGLMLGIGASVIASIRLARGDTRSANLTMSQAFAAGTLAVIALSAVGIFMPEATARALGCSDALMALAVDYLIWLSPGLPFLLLECVGMMLIRLDGSPRYAMALNIVAASFNIILDYILVFPLGMGVKGAAMATSISCALGGLMVLLYFIRYSAVLKFVRLNVKSFNSTLRNIGRMAKIGFSAFLTELAMSVMMLAGNYTFISALGEDGVAAFSIACYLFPVIFSMSNAVAQSAQPIISYNYGAGNTGRVKRALNVSLLAAIICGTVVTLIVAAGTKLIVGMFLVPTEHAYSLACSGLPLYALCGIFFALNIAYIGYYQSLEMAARSTLYTLLRGIVFIVAAFAVLPRIWGIEGMWLAIPASEALTLLIIMADRVMLCKRNNDGIRQ